MQATRSTLLLRIAAALFALLAIGHTFGMFQSSRSAEEAAVFRVMQEYQFPVMGFTRSHWQFYQGFGFTISVCLLLLAVLCWLLAGLSWTHSRQARPFAVALFLGSLVITLLSWMYFFLAPALVSTALTLVLGLAVRSLARTVTV